MADLPAQPAPPDGGPLRSPLHAQHVALGARFADFAGWSMPLQYPTGVEEHTAVRTSVGIFDVSHLGKVLVRGAGAADLVNRTLSNDLSRIAPSGAQYTLCCDEGTGGIVDDLIVYLHAPDSVLLVPNAANAAEVAARLRRAAPEGVDVVDHHREYAVLAIQGTRSDEVLDKVGLPAGHAYMSFVEAPFEDGEVVVCRTGYTGERGYELIARNDLAEPLWDALLAAGAEFGVLPCGLGARDTLRTEMGYPLHGQDISLDVTPNQARLGWAVGWQKAAFWGREPLLAEREAGPRRRLRGLVAKGRAIPRPGMGVTLTADVPLADITSGTFSPTLKKGIAMALIPTMVDPEAELGVDVRGRREIFTSTSLPFLDTSVREG